MNTDKFSKLEQGDQFAYTMVVSMPESEFLKAIQESDDLMGLFKIGRMRGKQLWVFNGDIDWDYYLQTGQYRVTSRVANPYVFGIDSCASFFGRKPQNSPE